MASSTKIKDFVRGSGPKIDVGYHRGDSWRQPVGPHSECSEKIYVVGPGLGMDKKGQVGRGILVRCGGCMWSWVIR